VGKAVNLLQSQPPVVERTDHNAARLGTQIDRNIPAGHADHRIAQKFHNQRGGSMLWDGGRSLFVQQLFGAFISGPTKTADVDQSLLIGAHGTHTLTIHSLG
jgi:hypothetical protein